MLKKILMALLIAAASFNLGNVTEAAYCNDDDSFGYYYDDDCDDNDDSCGYYYDNDCDDDDDYYHRGHRGGHGYHR